VSYRHDDGQLFGTGLQPARFSHLLTAYADDMPVYDRPTIAQKIAEGKGDLSGWVLHILNQTQHETCWAHATTLLMMKLAMLGYEDVVLDPTIGALLFGDEGNSIDTMITQVQTTFGQPDAAYTGNDPVAGREDPSIIPADWKTQAAKRIVPQKAWRRLASVEEVASALIDGHPCCWGLAWQGGGHAQAVAKVTVDAAGKLTFYDPNSWGVSYQSGYRAVGPSMPGWSLIHESVTGATFGGEAPYGAYCLAGAIDLAV